MSDGNPRSPRAATAVSSRSGPASRSARAHRPAAPPRNQPRRSPTQLDGVAIIWRLARLQLIHAEAIEYRDLADEPGHVDAEAAERARKHNVGLLVVLSDAACAGREIVFGTTHVLWNPKRGHVKLQQLAMYTRRAAALASSRAALGHGPPPAIVLSGDFNCTPGSLLHRYLGGDTGVRAALSSEGTWDGQRPAHAPAPAAAASAAVAGSAEPAVAFGRHALSGAVCSAYAALGEPAVTTSHGGFQGAVDSIFYTPERLRLVDLLPTPTRAQLAATGPLPTRHVPSDHVPIAADFAWVDTWTPPLPPGPPPPLRAGPGGRPDAAPDEWPPLSRSHALAQTR